MKGQVQPYKKARLWLRNHRTVIMVALCMAIMVCPAFAVDVAIDDATKDRLTSMFSSLDTVYSFIKGVCLIAAAASVASLGYAFFFITSSDAEERVTKAKARLFHIVTACGVLFMLPTILTIAQDAIGTTAWSPVETTSNHIITPVKVKDSASSLSAFAGMDGASDESGDSSNTNQSGNNTNQSGNNTNQPGSGSSGQNGNTQMSEEKKKKIENMKKDSQWSTYQKYWDKKQMPSTENGTGEWENYSAFLERNGLTIDDATNH